MMKTMKFILPILAILGIALPAEGHIRKSVSILLEELWKRVSDGRVVITSPRLDSFLARYDPNQRAGLDLIECNFKTGARSWVRDFSGAGVTTEYAAAYFKTLDVSGTGLYSRLTIEDVDELVEICEKHVRRCYGECRGLLTQEEFKAGFREVIFRSLPFTLLYVRFTRHEIDGSFDCDNTMKRQIPQFYHSSQRIKGPARRWQVASMSQGPDVQFVDEFQYEQMTRRDWDLLFLQLSRNNRGRINAGEMQTFWELGNYGTREEGLKLFNALAQDSPSLTYVDWEELFYELDCRNGNKRLDIAEFLQLDLIMNGLKRRGDGMCKLHRQ